MPLTAVHATAGVLDLTAPLACSPVKVPRDGAAVAWDDIYKVKPRAPLACRECGHGVHAKVSDRGLRFFAHDRDAPTCGLTGESLAHRLLKIELASAIRAAGWHAELEVPGDGWRADVLAISPEGTRRMAWEAQLAATTAAELAERTATMATEGVTVCWVTDKDRPFVGHVPSIRIRASEPDVETEDHHRTGQLVIDGLGTFEPDWCQPPTRCQIWAQHGYYGRDEGPCPGHGRWARPTTTLALDRFVAHVLTGSVRLHQVRAQAPWGHGRHRPGNLLWTTQPHWRAEQDQVDATAAAAAATATNSARRAAEQKRVDDHLAAIAALEARQKALTAPAVDLVGQEASGYVGVRDSAPKWAMGVPLFVRDQPQAVIAPVASRVQGEVRERLKGLIVIVASAKERDRLARVCAPGQRIVVFDVPIETPPTATVRNVTPHEVVSMMFGRRF